MNVRELIKQLECCELDKEVTILVTVTAEDEEGYRVLLKEITAVIDNPEVVAIR